jgi:hypothetical protein
VALKFHVKEMIKKKKSEKDYLKKLRGQECSSVVENLPILGFIRSSPALQTQHNTHQQEQLRSTSSGKPARNAGQSEGFHHEEACRSQEAKEGIIVLRGVGDPSGRKQRSKALTSFSHTKPIMEQVSRNTSHLSPAVPQVSLREHRAGWRRL